MKKKNTIALSYIVILSLLFSSKSYSQQSLWEATGGPAEAEALALATSDAGKIYCGTSNGLFVSSDNGARWESKTNGLPDEEFFTLSLAVNSSGEIFLGTFGLFRSTDGGENWSEIVIWQDMQSTILAIELNSNCDIFVAPFVTRSTDNGANWSPVLLPSQYANALLVQGSNTVFAGTNDGIYRSTNNGDNWTQVNNGLGWLDVYALAANSSGHIFAGVGSIYGQAIGIGLGLYRSTDGGNTWVEINTGIKDAFGNGPGVAAITTNSSGHIFASTYTGFYRSTNNGNSWTKFNTGLPEQKVVSLAFDNNNRLLAGTQGAGVYRTIQKATSVEVTEGATPASLALQQNYPNPFNAGTTIAFSVPQAAEIELAIYNINGEFVKMLAFGFLAAGSYQKAWDGTDLHGLSVASGVYLYQLSAKGFVVEKKLILVK